MKTEITQINHNTTSMQTDDLYIEYNERDSDEPVIRVLQVWNCKRDVWEDADSLPEFVEQFIYNKAIELINK